MKGAGTICTLAVALGTGLLLAATTNAPGNGTTPQAAPGWTGLSKPNEVIHARAELMEHMEELMRPIDTITVQPVRDRELLRFNAEVLGAMLGAVPHLFPPTTNLYDPKAITPETLALPAIWRNFDCFYSLAEAARRAAEEFAASKGDAALRNASLKLRASCDACHALYLRKYMPPQAQPSDYLFDFSSAFPAKR
jgi:cytochrome c556